MNTLRSILRCAVVTSLLLGLSTTSLFSRSMAGDCLTESKQGGGPKVCCCGSKDGRCCGMACCQTPIPKEKAPASPKPSENRGQPLGFAQTANLGIVGLNCAGYHFSCIRDSAKSGSPSLIALCIRINT